MMKQYTQCWLVGLFVDNIFQQYLTTNIPRHEHNSAQIEETEFNPLRELGKIATVC